MKRESLSESKQLREKVNDYDNCTRFMRRYFGNVVIALTLWIIEFIKNRLVERLWALL